MRVRLRSAIVSWLISSVLAIERFVNWLAEELAPVFSEEANEAAPRPGFRLALVGGLRLTVTHMSKLDSTVVLVGAKLREVYGHF